MDKPLVFDMPNWFLLAGDSSIPMQIRMELWQAVLDNSEYARDGSDTLTIVKTRWDGKY